MSTRAESLGLGRTSPRPNPRGGARVPTRSPRPSKDAQKLRVVPKSAPKNAKARAESRARSVRANRRLLITLCTFLTVALAFGVAVSHVIVAQNQDRLDKLNRRLDAEQTRYEKLRYQVAELESPERVVATARERLGMIEPPKVNYVPPVSAESVAEAEVTEAPDWRLVKAELAAE